MGDTPASKVACVAVSRRDLTALNALLARCTRAAAADGSDSLAGALIALGRLIRADSMLWFGSRRTAGERSPWCATPLQQQGEVISAQLLHRLLWSRARNQDLLGRAARPGEVGIISLGQRCPGKGDPLRREKLREQGLVHALLANLQIDTQCGAHLLLARRARRREFSERDRSLLYLFMSGSMAWHREQLLCGGWIEAEKPLTARERDVLSGLLSDATEPEIAGSLGLSSRTTHQYVTAIYRRFGVSGRRGLMALFLRYRGQGEAPAP